MPRVTRSSAAHLDIENAEQETEDVINILNDVAANTPHGSSPKRKRTSVTSEFHGSSVQKRTQAAQVAQPAPSTADTPSRRQSGRLQARRSLAAPTAVDKRNPFDLPTEDEVGILPPAQLAPVNKVRKLKKQDKNTASPLNAFGEVDTSTSARVNLDASPVKRRPGRPQSIVRNKFQKIGASLKRAGHPIESKNETSLVVDEVQSDEDALVTITQKSPRSRTRRKGQVKEAEYQPAPELEESSRDSDVTSNIDATNDNEDAGTTQAPTEPDPKSNEPTEEEKREAEMMAEQLSGIEKAVEVHDCRNFWAEALLAAAEITRDKASLNPLSTIGGACDREFRNLTKVYKNLNKDSSRSLPPRDPGVRETLARLVNRCKHLRSQRHKPGPDASQRKKMYQDIYEHLIPRSLQLARWALKARFRDGNLSISSLKEICKLLNITSSLIETGRAWQPKPKLEKGVKGKTSSRIKGEVNSILAIYLGVIDQDRKDIEDEEMSWRREASKANLVNAFKQRCGREEGNTKYRTEGRQTHGHVAARLQSEVAESDDMSEDEQDTRTARRQAPAVQHRVNGEEVNHTRPRVKRQLTEDIPAPTEPQWSAVELTVLSNALQEFTDASRWEDIVDKHCGSGGRLQRYDMDQIMAKATWIKQTMAWQLENELDESWDWLRSVPS